MFNMPDYGQIVSALVDPFDVELLIDFNLFVRITFIHLFGKLTYSPYVSYSAITACQIPAFKMATGKPGN